MSAPARRPVGHAMEQGFSLIEMMVVLLLLALVAGLVAPTLRGAGRQKSPESVAGELQAVFLSARTNAIARGNTEIMQIDLAKREVLYAGAKRLISIPENLTPALLVGRELVADDGEAALLFFADGGSSGAKITLTDQRNHAAGVVVPWLTGIPIVLRNE